MITSDTLELALPLDRKPERDSYFEDSTESLLQIEPLAPYAMLSPEIGLHVKNAKNFIKRCLSEEFSDCDGATLQSALLDKLPLIAWDSSKSIPGCITSTILCVASKGDNTETRLESILKGWVVPGKSTQVLSQHSLYFQWNLFETTSFLVLQWTGLVENKSDMDIALSNLPSFTTQLVSALKNPVAFKNFFSHKPLLQDLKQAKIHEELVLLLQRFPHFFSVDLLSEMGRFLALAEKSFFEPRSSRLITKIISFHYLMRLNLTRLPSLYPEKRHVEVRFVKTDLNFYFGSKPVLGLIIGMSPLDNHEFFEESHISQAVQSLLPHLNTIKSSFYSYQKLDDPICTLYVEIEKKDGSTFSSKELQILKKGVGEELKRRVEKLVPSIFMHRNEEEVMRNILLLSQELKYLSDIPQVIISLDTQNLSEISFTVVLVRILKPNQLPIKKHFEMINAEMSFISDRTQQVGFIRKNYPKEANVFHLKIRKDPSLLRADYSVNFYLARNKATAILSEAIGPFRDYNGGMILKQGELFYQFQDSFSDVAQKNPELLENFFFSLSPIEAQATLPLFSLTTLFSQFLEAQKRDLSQKEDYFLRIEERQGQLFAMIRLQGKSFKEELNLALGNRELLSKSLIYNSIQIQGSLYTGLVLSYPEERKRQLFIEAIHEALKNWIHKTQNQQIVKLSFSSLPSTLDPGMAGERSSHIITKMLFEGLTRLDKDGKPTLALAKSIDVSPDLKQYVFKLKQAYWSNGAQITAYDFEHAWKKILSPQFPTPFAYMLYPIKNAKPAKENLCGLSEVGIFSLDPMTLSVELENPTPELPELLTHSLFSPIHHVTDKVDPNWAEKGSSDFVCNGPFLLKNIVNHTRYELVKNPFYWDKESVRLQGIRFSKNSTFTANEMFKKEEIHWIGSSIGGWEFFLENNPETQIHSSYIGIYWCIFNTKKFPFNNTLLRQAFNLAIDKHDLVSKIHADHLPASTPLPLSLSMNHNFEGGLSDEKKAVELFEMALQELGLSRHTFPLITLNYLNTPLRKKTFAYLQEKWKTLFQIPCRLEGFNFNSLLAKTMKGDFQISGLQWKTCVDNPSYALEIFKYDNMEMNTAKWTNPEYQELLQKVKHARDPVEKVKFLSEAEKALAAAVPIIPLFYEKEKNIVKSYLHQVIHSKTTGNVDFKYAYIDKKTGGNNSNFLISI